MICECDHRLDCHAYLSFTASNSGRCLIKGCDCPGDLSSQEEALF